MCLGGRRVRPRRFVFGGDENNTYLCNAFQARVVRTYQRGGVTGKRCLFRSRSCQRAMTAVFCSDRMSLRDVESCLKRACRRVAERCVSCVPREVTGTGSRFFRVRKDDLTS